MAPSILGGMSTTQHGKCFHILCKKKGSDVSLFYCCTIISGLVLGRAAPSLLLLEKRVKITSGPESTTPAAISTPAKPNSHTHTHKNAATHRNGKSDPLCNLSCRFFFLKWMKKAFRIFFLSVITELYIHILSHTYIYISHVAFISKHINWLKPWSRNK